VRDFYNYEAKGNELLSEYGSLTPAKSAGDSGFQKLQTGQQLKGKSQKPGASS
jgi:hypothetical protein